MDTLHLSPRLRAPVPRLGTWLIIVIAGVLMVMTWWATDLWRLTTWERAQIEVGADLPHHKQLLLALFGALMTLLAATMSAFAHLHGWHYYELIAALFPLGFLYSVATYYKVAF